MAEERDADWEPQLLNEDADTSKPLITYRKHRRYFGCGLVSRRPALIVQPELKESLDTIIGACIAAAFQTTTLMFCAVSFLLMERLRRDRLLRLTRRKTLP